MTDSSWRERNNEEFGVRDRISGTSHCRLPRMVSRSFRRIPRRSKPLKKPEGEAAEGLPFYLTYYCKAAAGITTVIFANLVLPRL